MFQTILGYFIIGFVAMIILAILYLPFYFLLRRRFPFRRQIAGFFFGTCILVICYVTFVDQMILNLQNYGTIFSSYHNLNLIPLQFLLEAKSGNTRSLTQAVANTFMFLPLGFILPVVFPHLRRLSKTSLCACAISFTIELVQYFIGRATDIDDLLLNTLGSVLGYFMYMAASKLLSLRQKAALHNNALETVK